MRCRRLLLLCLTAATIFQPMQLTARAQAPARPAGKAAASGPFKTPLTLDQMKNKQAVLETSAGTIIIQHMGSLFFNSLYTFGTQVGLYLRINLLQDFKLIFFERGTVVTLHATSALALFEITNKLFRFNVVRDEDLSDFYHDTKVDR